MLCIGAGFLKTFLGGTLLFVIRINGNNRIFAIAWATADGENNDIWVWYLQTVKHCVENLNHNGITIILYQLKVRHISIVVVGIATSHVLILIFILTSQNVVFRQLSML